MRFTVVLLSMIIALTTGAIAQTASMTPDALVERGIASYRAGNYAAAATDLDAASQALLSQERMQEYVNTGKFAGLDRFETALIYLTLAQSKLGHTAQAREAVLRLMTAERINPTYAQLPLTSEVAEFEPIAAKLVPASALPANPQMARATTIAPAPTPVPPPAAPIQVAQTTTAPAPAPAQTQTQAQAQSDRERYIEQRLTEERAKWQREADERIAQIQREADLRVAEAQKEAAAQIAAIQEQDRRSYLLSLRNADAMAAAGKINQANDIYNTIVMSPGAAREIIAEAAIGLYRTGAYRNAAGAFRKLAPYAHGEEDLRYYNAVSLYETGDFAEARRELACALPYIQVTEDVTRYREKIEQGRSQASSN